MQYVNVQACWITHIQDDKQDALVGNAGSSRWAAARPGRGPADDPDENRGLTCAAALITKK